MRYIPAKFMSKAHIRIITSENEHMSDKEGLTVHAQMNNNVVLVGKSQKQKALDFISSLEQSMLDFKNMTIKTFGHITEIYQ
jgi:hypothetical protein